MWRLRQFSRWAEDHPFAVDASLTLLALTVVVPLSTDILNYEPGHPWLPWIAVALVVPLAFRRRYAVWSAALVFAVALLHWIAGVFLLVPADFAVLAALYSLAAHGPVWASRVGLVGGLVGAILVGIPGFRFDLASTMFFSFTAAALVLMSWALGVMRSAKRERWDALRARAQQLEADGKQRNRLAIAAERTRIAREMHDVVAHSLSIMIAQADGGRYAAKANPDLGVEALETIADTGRAALSDMRKILGVLRSDDHDVSLTSPAPSLADIRELVQSSRKAGVRIAFTEMGRDRSLPAGAGMALFRVCQESLTNIRKHAGPDPEVSLSLQWLDTSVRLVITDDGRGAAASRESSGHGLLGIRERADLFGGTAEVGPRPGGGFFVEFELPLPHSSTFSEEEFRWQTPQ